MSIAERTRAATDSHPFLVEALRAGVVNYTAAARFLDIGETEAVAAALRRYASELSPRTKAVSNTKVRMITGIGRTEGATDALLRIGTTSFEPEGGTLTAIVVEGQGAGDHEVEIRWQLREHDIGVHAVATTSTQCVIVTDRNDGPSALRLIEDELTADSRD